MYKIEMKGVSEVLEECRLFNLHFPCGQKKELHNPLPRETSTYTQVREELYILEIAHRRHSIKKNSRGQFHFLLHPLGEYSNISRFAS